MCVVRQIKLRDASSLVHVELMEAIACTYNHRERLFKSITNSLPYLVQSLYAANHLQDYSIINKINK